MYASRLKGCLFLLAVCVLVYTYLSSPRHRLSLSSTRQVVVEHGECRNRCCEDRGKALVVNITFRFHRLVVMPEACARGYTQRHWADAACAAVLLFSAQVDACASHNVWKPKLATFGHRRCPKVGLHFRLEAVPKMISYKMARKNTNFGSIRLMTGFAVRKRTISVFKNLP